MRRARRCVPGRWRRQSLARRAAEADRGPHKRRRDSDAAVAADALVEMARHAGAASPADPLRPTPAVLIHVRVDHAALVRGHTERGEVCEVPGVGPVTVGWVGTLLADAVVAALEVDDGEVLRVAHLGRVIPARVRTALLERDRKCVVPGCSTDSGLEIDHIRPIAAGGRTELANLCRLCRHHHYLKTHHGWRISRQGKRWFWEGPPRSTSRSERTTTRVGGGRFVVVMGGDARRGRFGTRLFSPASRDRGGRPSTGRCGRSRTRPA